MSTDKKYSLKALQAKSFLSSGSSYLDELYESYLEDPNSVPHEWLNYFRNLPQVNGATTEISHALVKEHFLDLAQQPQVAANVPTDVATAQRQTAVTQLVDAYRRYGHKATQLDPLGSPRAGDPRLEMSYYGLSDADLDTKFNAPLLFMAPTPLKDIVAALKKTYCNHIAFQYQYINDPEEVAWLEERIEATHGTAEFSKEVKLDILKKLTAAEGLEKYLGSKYVGQKRFSLEGSDSLIPLMHQMIERASEKDVEEIAIGMAHRGRLNVMVNIVGKSPEELFEEFEGRKDFDLTTGDVKYHMGFSSDVKTKNGEVHLALGFNPSHLEAIGAVIMGSTRARQRRWNGNKADAVMPIIIHGDSAIAGQGIVMETFNMAQTRAHHVGGAVRIVVNNQIGFTTSDPHDTRSSEYCTDIAKMVDVPVFHVNGDDPEAVIFCAQLAVDYRLKFNKDVIVDLVCYRLHGHNEADEPSATQPLMYKKIKSYPTPRAIYAEQLEAENVCDAEFAKKMLDDYRSSMEKGQVVIDLVPNSKAHTRAANWSQYIGQDWSAPADTKINKEELIRLAKKLEQLPEAFQVQRQVNNMLENRKKMTRNELPIDWGYGEILAYATLLNEGHHVRLIGQDSQRGTFGHRHAVLHDQKIGKIYTPLQHVDKNQAEFEVYNSLLSEEGALGFEYGYATTDPGTLVLWEAQFGDFANGAQVIIDQFISSGWQKWKRLCGLVMLLPHGQEGMGPEHSSARLERYLQLSAQQNIQVVVPTTPAQIFHLLRRQCIRPFRKPLIVMTPKSLLRHKLAVSTLDDLANGKFYLVLPEVNDLKPSKIRKVVICSGKVYYNLLIERREKKIDDVAIVRIEQLYPFPHDELNAELKKYKNAKQVVWCQEEPKNQGAWHSKRHCMVESLCKGQELSYVGRSDFAAPAAGYPALHNKQQQELVEEALK